MTLRTIDLGMHTAHLDLTTGDGLLVCPRADDDVQVGFDPLTGAGSLAWADYTAALAQLASLGWVPAENNNGEHLREGWTEDGRLVVGLFGLDPIRTVPELDVTAGIELAALAGVVKRP